MVRKVVPYLLGLGLAALHLGLVVLVFVVIAASGDPEAGMLFAVFDLIDAPIAKYDPDGFWIVGVGTLWWFGFGFAIQSLFFCWQKRGLRRLGVSLAGLFLVSLSPNLRLAGKPSWEQAYMRGTQAANSGDTAAGIRFLHDAIRLAGPDHDFTISLYTYLGNLCVAARDYGQAVEAARNQVALALKQSARRKDETMQASTEPSRQVMNAYNDLSTAYSLAGRTADEEAALVEAAKWDRIVYHGDSIQEANCWDALADIAFDRGDRARAVELLEKARGMSAKFEQTDSFTMNYINERLTEWKKTP